MCAAWILHAWPFLQQLLLASTAVMLDCGSLLGHPLHAWSGHVECPGSLLPPLCPVFITQAVSKTLQMVESAAADRNF